jgi:hypothetical protein
VKQLGLQSGNNVREVWRVEDAIEQGPNSSVAQ